MSLSGDIFFLLLPKMHGGKLPAGRNEKVAT